MIKICNFNSILLGEILLVYAKLLLLYIVHECVLFSFVLFYVFSRQCKRLSGTFILMN